MLSWGETWLLRPDDLFKGESVSFIVTRIIDFSEPQKTLVFLSGIGAFPGFYMTMSHPRFSAVWAESIAMRKEVASKPLSLIHIGNFQSWKEEGNT